MSSREIMNAQGFGSKKYSLDCSYYNKEFNSIDELIDDIASSGMDPNYEITCNGINTGELFNIIYVFSKYLSFYFILISILY